MCEAVVKRFDVFFKPESVLFFLEFTEEGITDAAKKVHISQTRGHAYVRKFIDGGLVHREYRGVYTLTEDGKVLKRMFQRMNVAPNGGVKIVDGEM